MPLSDTGRQLLTSLLSQKSLDVQKRHAEREAAAHRKTAGNLNGYALPSALLDAHAETMREFGQSILSAHQEAFEADRQVPDERDVQEITDQIARTLEYRRDTVQSEFSRLQMRLGRELPPGLPSELTRRQEQMLSELHREVDVWRLKSQLVAKNADTRGAQTKDDTSPRDIHFNIQGDHNQVSFAGRDQAGTTQIAALQAATGGTLTEEEKELLRAAARRGEFLVVPTDQYGSMLLVEKRSFFDQADPAVAARYLEALERLKRRGLVRFDEGHLYVLTGSGFETARAL